MHGLLWMYLQWDFPVYGSSTTNGVLGFSAVYKGTWISKQHRVGDMSWQHSAIDLISS